MTNEQQNCIKSILNQIRLERGFDLNKTFQDIESYIKHCEEMRDKAIDTLEKWNKDQEIQKLNAEIFELKELMKKKREGYSIFEITPEENEEIKKWIEQHINEKHNGDHYAGAIGGRFTYKFTPTSIGDIGEIVCSCGEKFCFRELS